MKRTKAIGAALALLWCVNAAGIGIGLGALTFGHSGCVSTTLPGTTLSEKNTDQIILRAEQSAEVAKTTFNTFLHLERDNEAFFKKVNPQIHAWAENIRVNGINWIVALRDATKTFKANRDSANQATLNTALLTLTNAVQLTQRYISEAKKVSNP